MTVGAEAAACCPNTASGALLPSRLRRGERPALLAGLSAPAESGHRRDASPVGNPVALGLDLPGELVSQEGFHSVPRSLLAVHGDQRMPPLRS